MIGALFRRVKDVHFVGIGGVGMSGLAEILLALDFRVSGSDMKESATTQRLKEHGAVVWEGHDGKRLERADVVVYSSAVTQDNPELVAARERRIPIIPRAEMLAELMRMQTSIAVAGMHGKTTTTSMIASIFYAAELDPTVVIGGKLDSLGGSGAKLGHGDLLVAEADESDRSFLKLHPTIALITNLDLEHMDCYSSMEEIQETFLEFINHLPFYGYAVVCLDDPEVQKIIPLIEKRFITYGTSSQATIHGHKPEFIDGASVFTVHKEDELLGEIRLPMPGIHNVLDALAAVTIADIFEIPFEVTQSALNTFPGVQRRFTLRGTAGGVPVYDDYGHHPTEIKAVLEAARDVISGRLAVLFQPHRFTRTQALFEEFLTAFMDSDLLYVMDIYPASEKPIEGVTSEALCEGIKSRGHKKVTYVPNRDAIPSVISNELEPGDAVITLGAGNVTNMGPMILDALRTKEKTGA